MPKQHTISEIHPAWYEALRDPRIKRLFKRVSSRYRRYFVYTLVTMAGHNRHHHSLNLWQDVIWMWEIPESDIEYLTNWCLDYQPVACFM